jgi:hypothetical protein
MVRKDASRPFDEREVWGRKVSRAVEKLRKDGDFVLGEIAMEAGLTLEQAEQGIEWCNERGGWS